MKPFFKFVETILSFADILNIFLELMFEIKDKIYVKTEDNQNNSNNKLVECLAKSDKKIVIKRVFLESKPINESNDNKSESNDFDKTLSQNWFTNKWDSDNQMRKWTERLLINV